MRTLKGPAPELGHSNCIYRACSILFLFALIIHIMETFFTALVISIHLTVLDELSHVRQLQLLMTLLEILSVSASSNKSHFLKENHKAAKKHIFYHCNTIKLCVVFIVWFYTDLYVNILPCYGNRCRRQWLSKHSLQCIELMVKL